MLVHTVAFAARRSPGRVRLVTLLHSSTFPWTSFRVLGHLHASGEKLAGAGAGAGLPHRLTASSQHRGTQYIFYDMDRQIDRVGHGVNDQPQARPPSQGSRRAGQIFSITG